MGRSRGQVLARSGRSFGGVAKKCRLGFSLTVVDADRVRGRSGHVLRPVCCAISDDKITGVKLTGDDAQARGEFHKLSFIR